MSALVEVHNLVKEFPGRGGLFRRGPSVRAVDDISFTVQPRETFGLVGESGCGKTTTAMAILRLVQPPGRIVGGQAIVEGTDLLALNERELREVR